MAYDDETPTDAVEDFDGDVIPPVEVDPAPRKRGQRGPDKAPRKRKVKEAPTEYPPMLAEAAGEALSQGLSMALGAWLGPAGPAAVTANKENFMKAVAACLIAFDVRPSPQVEAVLLLTVATAQIAGTALVLAQQMPQQPPTA